ncbi:MAG TPA: Mur ligase domain-containing protein, partial [Propionibacteriaceae bacterium]
MIPVTVDEIAMVLGTRLSGPEDGTAVITALTADSRSVIPGALFVALRGEQVDGHDYVAAA